MEQAPPNNNSGQSVERLEVLWREHGPVLKGYIRRRVADHAAEDVLQEVFLKARLGVGQLREPTAARAWLYRIARHAVADHHRDRKANWAPSPEALAPATAPENEAKPIIAVCLGQMIQRLPEHYRQAIVLTAYQGLSQRELAEALGLSLSGAKSRVQRARARLKQMLLDCCALEFDRRNAVIDYEPRAATPPARR